MLEFPDAWVWDAWYADDGERHHAFHLVASRALLDPDRRHRRASIGHSWSSDLRSWERMPDSLVRGEPGEPDDVAPWTGSVVRDDDGLWWMFYTGLSDRPAVGTQRVLAATSSDLVTWKRYQACVVEADARWYRTAATGEREDFRDPWVMRDPGGGWRMLVTASVGGAEAGEEGAIGVARSDDLRQWIVEPPITLPRSGFGQFEVPQLVNIDDQWILLFCCGAPSLGVTRGTTGGTFGLLVDPDGPWDMTRAVRLTDESCYAGRAVRDRDGTWLLLGFEGGDDFRGRISDPIELEPLLRQSGVIAKSGR